jgi:hypothetical protein
MMHSRRKPNWPMNLTGHKAARRLSASRWAHKESVMTYALVFLMLLLAPANVYSVDPSTACSLDVQVEALVPVADLRSDGILGSDQLKVYLRNSGPSRITLVEPGDGSDRAWRTPILTWHVEVVGGSYAPPELLLCGNINALRPGEVFSLEPGELRALSKWVPPIWIARKGIYKLRLAYQNDPILEWKGIPLSEHDKNEMSRVRASTPCTAMSNEVTIEVKRVPKR